MRKLISATKISIDGKLEGPEGYADWVAAWSDDYDLTAQVDACVLGGRMYEGYETYWTSIQNEPDGHHWITGEPPTKGELEWAEFAARTPHYVLSRTMTSATWPATTTFLRSFDDLAALKEEDGKDIYLMVGARLTSALLDADLVDELRLIVYPLVSGEGTPLFTGEQRRLFELHKVQQLPGGLVSLVYGS